MTTFVSNEANQKMLPHDDDETNVCKRTLRPICRPSIVAFLHTRDVKGYTAAQGSAVRVCITSRGHELKEQASFNRAVN